MAMAIQTAIIITGICSTIPTAVITESKENTASSTTIWATTVQKCEVFFGFPSSWAEPSRRSLSSIVALKSKNSPPINIINWRALNVIPNFENSGVLRVTNQPAIINNKTRVINANARPVIRALSRW